MDHEFPFLDPRTGSKRSVPYLSMAGFSPASTASSGEWRATSTNSETAIGRGCFGGRAMWTCQVCRAESEDDGWEQCWSCGEIRSLGPGESEAIRDRAEQERARLSRCQRCAGTLAYRGGRWYRDDFRVEFRSRGNSFDVYTCERCGHVELFVQGVGENLRPPKTPPAAEARAPDEGPSN